MSGLDPSARAALEFVATQAAPPIETLSASEARDGYLRNHAEVQNPFEPVSEVQDITLGVLRLRLWRGRGAENGDAPALLYVHGGGWVIGAPETHEDICRSIANRMGAVVVSPDYRLAPEQPFPAAVEDCLEVLRFLHSDAAKLGVDPARIAVGGDSAGGNLAAVLALMSRDGDAPAITAQLLIYPVCDCSREHASYARYADGFGLTAAGMRWFRKGYLGGDGVSSDWLASPLNAPDLAGVAPAFLALAGHDVLYDEGEAYAARLGRETDVIRQSWPGQIHGFVSMRGQIPEGDDALNQLVDAWRQFEKSRANAP